MRNRIFTVLTGIITMVLIAGCKKESLCDKGETAILYYIPECATINGFVVLAKSGENLIFQHEIDSEFRKSGVEVCITYNRKEEPTHLTADCVMGDVVIITSIQAR